MTEHATSTSELSLEKTPEQTPEKTHHRRAAITALIASARYLAGDGTKIVIITLRDGDDPDGITVTDADIPPLAILGPGGDSTFDLVANAQ